VTHPHELLSAHLDGELSRDEATAVAEHLGGCKPCRVELEALAEVRSAVRSLPMLEAPIPLLPRRRRAGRMMVAASSAAAVALAAALVAVPESAPAPGLDAMAGQHNARVVVDPGISTIRGPVAGP